MATTFDEILNKVRAEALAAYRKRVLPETAEEYHKRVVAQMWKVTGYETMTLEEIHAKGLEQYTRKALGFR